MVCYAPGTGTLAVLGCAVYLVWHRAIMHFLSVVGMAMEVTLVLGVMVAVTIFVVWTARMIRHRQAAAGACTTCRFRCQEALPARPNLLINQVDRRVTSPLPVRRAALTCHPAGPILPALGLRRGPARHAAIPRAVPATASQAAAPNAIPAAAPRTIPMLGQRIPPLPSARPVPALGWRRAALLNWRRTPLLNWQGIPLLGSRHALTRPAVALPASRALDGARTLPAPRTPSAPRTLPAPRTPGRGGPAVAATGRWSPAPRETVAFDGYVLTPEGVDALPDPVRDPRY